MAEAKKNRQKGKNDPPKTTDGPLHEATGETGALPIDPSTLINAIPDPILLIDAHGKIQMLNRAAVNAYGFDPTGMHVSELPKRMRLRLPNGRAVPSDKIPIIRALGGDNVAAERFVFSSALGQERTIEASSSPLLSDGDITGAIVVFRDITERQRATQKLSSQVHFLQVLLNAIPAPVFYKNTQGVYLGVNKAFEEYLGLTGEQIVGKTAYDIAPKDLADVYHRADKELFDNPGVQIYEASVMYADGTRHDVVFYKATFNNPDGTLGGLIGTILDITERKRAEEALRRAKRLSDALNDINGEISSTLSVDEIMERVVAESAQALGCEAAAIYLHRENRWVLEYAYGLPRQMIGMSFTREEARALEFVSRARKSLVSNDALSDERLNRKQMEKFGVRSLLTIPLIAKKEAIGALSFYYLSAPVAFSDDEIDFATKLSVSTSLALENAGLYEAQRDIAETLQTSLLLMPDHISGIESGHLYRSATEAAQIGGDFYDIFELEHEKVGIIIGDVAGKGIEAAAMTTVVKNTIKAHAYEDGTPAIVMLKTNDLVRRVISPGGFISVFFAILDTKTGGLSYCSAGHPPAIVKRENGGTELLEKHSPVVGAFAEFRYRTAKTRLRQGDTLIVYTDGVVEARCAGGFYGQDRLVELVENLHPIPVEEVPQVILDDVTRCSAGRLSDDVAILAVSLESHSDGPRSLPGM